MTKRTIAFAVGGAVIVAAGLATGLALGTSSAAPAAATGSGTAPTGTALTGTAQRAPEWMTSTDGYSTMMGRYGDEPMGHMMGGGMPGGVAMGKIMGRVLDETPGPTISAAEAAAEAGAVPQGAVADQAADRLTFSTSNVSLTLVAGPEPGTMYRFEAAGMIDPQIVVPGGARVTLRLVNADTDMAHGIVVTSSDITGSWMPMMSGRAAFRGGAIWALGEADSAGARTATTTFTAVAGSYTYLCPVPGHSQVGMYGTLTVG